MSESPIQWFISKLEDVNGAQGKDTLLEVKSGLLSLTSDVLINLASHNLGNFFRCIQESGEEEAELACDVLVILLPLLPPLVVLNTYGLAVQNALSHPSIKVKRKFLNLLLNCTSVDCLSVMMTSLQGVFSQVIECLVCSDRAVAEGAVMFFKMIGQTSQGVSILFNDPFVSVLKRAMQSNDIARFRVYEICVDVAAKSETEGLEAAHRAGFLQELLAELKSTDPLLQLNALELITNLAATSAGFLYLQREGVVKYLFDLISNIQNQPLSFILLPGLIEFFGNFCMRQPEIFSQQHPEVLNLLFDSFATVDPALLGVVISTLGKIGSSDAGKRVLKQNENKMQQMLEKLGEVIQRKDALCITGFSALNSLICTNNVSLVETCHLWFQALGPKGLSNIVDTCKLPFVDLRHAALSLLCSISHTPWGAPMICQTAGLVEFLMDRDVEFDKDCKMTKHSVISGLVSNPSLNVTSDLLSKLKQHVNEGPFYVTAQLLTEVEQM